MGRLRVVETPNGNKMMDVRLSTHLLHSFPTPLTFVFVPLQRFPSNGTPLSGVVCLPSLPLVVVFTTPIFRHPLGETVLTTESLLSPFHVGFQDLANFTTVVTRPFDSLTSKLESGSFKSPLRRNAIRTEVSLFIRWIILEFVTTRFAGRSFFRTLPVAVVFGRVRVTVVAVLQPSLFVVKFCSTPLALPVR